MPQVKDHFSVHRRVKTYLRSIMSQNRLNHLMMLAVYKEITDKLDLVECAKEFVSGNEHRISVCRRYSQLVVNE